MSAVLRTVRRLDVKEEIRTVHGVVIERGIPIPSRLTPSPVLDVLAALEPGDSFVHASRCCDTRKALRKRFPDRSFAARRVDSKRWRIWRTK